MLQKIDENVFPLKMNDETKILTETDTFSKTKFFETDTFVPRPNSLKPKLRLFFRDQILRNQNWDFFYETKFFETDSLCSSSLTKINPLTNIT